MHCQRLTSRTREKRGCTLQALDMIGSQTESSTSVIAATATTIRMFYPISLRPRGPRMVLHTSLGKKRGGGDVYP